MNFNIWTAKISVAFKIIVFFIHVHKHYVAKSIASCKKNPYIINQNHIFSKKYCKVIAG